MGDTIVSPDWIEEMIKPHVDDLYSYSFGYQWWIAPEPDLHFMAGHGGQFAIISNDLDLVVVMTAIPNTQGSYQIELDEAIDLAVSIMATCN